MSDLMHIYYLSDAAGRLQAVQLSPALWEKVKDLVEPFLPVRSFLNFPTQCRNLWRVFPSSCSTGILPIRTIRLSSVRIAAKLRKTGVLRLNILLSWSTPTWEGSWFFVAKTVRQLSGKSIFAIMWLWSTARRSADPDREVSFIAAPYFFRRSPQYHFFGQAQIGLCPFGLDVVMNNRFAVAGRFRKADISRDHGLKKMIRKTAPDFIFYFTGSACYGCRTWSEPRRATKDR